MGILDFFKNIVKENKVEEIIKEKLAFSEIEDWTKRKREENEVKEKEILVLIGKEIEGLTTELREKIIVLEAVDVESKKEKEEIKGVVINGRRDYIHSVENLLEELNKLELDGLEGSIQDINKVFLDFNKSSYKNYARTTILVGKEMGSIKESLKIFSNGIIKTFDENKEIVDSFKGVSSIMSKLAMVRVFDGTLKEIGETIQSLNKEIDGRVEESQKLSEEIEKIKESPAYLERLKIQEKIGSLKEEVKKDIFELKQSLNFKALANFFHTSEERMKRVKEHKEEFQFNFEKDKGETIIELLDKSKLNKDTISKKVDLIRNKLEETTNYEKGVSADETRELSSQLKWIMLEIDNLKMERAKEEKRGEKSKVGKAELMDSLKQELNKADVELV